MTKEKGEKMARYIDADAIIEFIDLGHYRNPLELCYSEQYVVDMIESRPTADVVEVKHGEWQVYYDEDSPQDGIWKCSICSYIRLIDDISPTSFCPNCGADMRGK